MVKHLNAKRSLTELVMLGSLTGGVLASAPVGVNADANTPWVQVTSGEKGAGVLVNKSVVTAKWSQIEQAKALLGDPAKVGSSIDHQDSLSAYKQDARTSLTAYEHKGEQYVDGQNGLSQSTKQDLKKNLQTTLSKTLANLDQTTSVDGVQTVLTSGAYAILTGSAATTVDHNQSVSQAQSQLNQNAGSDVVNTKVDHQVDRQDTSLNQNYQQNLQANGDQAGASSNQSTDNTKNNDSTSNHRQVTPNKKDNPKSSTEELGRGIHFKDVYDLMDAATNSFSKYGDYRAVNGSTLTMTVRNPHFVKNVGTVFHENSVVFRPVADLKAPNYSNLKTGDKVNLTVDDVTTGSADSNTGEWSDFVVDYSNLQIVSQGQSQNKGQDNKQAGDSNTAGAKSADSQKGQSNSGPSQNGSGATNGNNGGQSGNQGQATGSDMGDPDNGQPGASANSPQGTVLPQTSDNHGNSWLSLVGMSLVAALAYPFKLLLKRRN